jgi:choline monooxygenase
VPVHEQVDVWHTNWKLLVENFIDAYHVFKVHKNSFGASGDSTADTEVFPGTEHWTHHRAFEEAGSELAHPANTRLTGPWRKTTVLAAVFPGLVVQLQPNWMWFLRITPIGTDQVRIAWQVAAAPEVLADQPDRDRYVAGLLELIALVNSEDQPIVEGVRRSIARPQFERAPLSYLERNVYDFDRYICRRLTGAG